MDCCPVRSDSDAKHRRPELIAAELIANDVLNPNSVKCEREDSGVDASDNLRALSDAVEAILKAIDKRGDTLAMISANILDAMRNLGTGAEEGSNACRSNLKKG